jgi:hypothetical protein
VAAHALLAAALWADAARSRPPARAAGIAAAPTVSWLRLLRPVPGADTAPPSAATRPAAARSNAKPLPAPRPRRVPLPAVATAIDGSVFALPHIAFATNGAALQRTTAVPTAVAPEPPPLRTASAPPDLAVRNTIEAARLQIARALQEQVNQLARPAMDGDGRCTLHAASQPALVCDSPALRRAVDPQAAVLAGLLHAYARADGLGVAIEFRDGRYRLAANARVVEAKPTLE